MNHQERKQVGTDLQIITKETNCENCGNPVEVGRNMFRLITEETENNWKDTRVKNTQLICRDCVVKNQTIEVTAEESKRRINLVQAHLAEIIDFDPTFRKEIEKTEKENTMDAYWKLEQKLARELFPKLAKHKGDSEATAYSIKLGEILNGIETHEEKWYRIRESIKNFLKSDLDITKSENLKKLTEETIEEDTMDGYYNLLKSFRKSYDELEKLKGGEEQVNHFLTQLTDVTYDRIKKVIKKWNENDRKHNLLS